MRRISSHHPTPMDEKKIEANASESAATAAAAPLAVSSKIFARTTPQAAPSAALQSGSAALSSMLSRSRSSLQNNEAQKLKPTADTGPSPSLNPLEVDVDMAPAALTDDDDDDVDDFFALMDHNLNRTASTIRRVTPSIEQEKAISTDKDNTTSSADGADEHNYSPLKFADPPLDWNLHSKIRFTSSQPFTWLERSSIECESQGLNAFTSSTHLSQCHCSSLSLLQEFYHAISYAVFPPTPFSKTHPVTGPFQQAHAKSMDAHTHADKLAINFVHNVWIQWEDSFRSLFNRLRLTPTSPSFLDHFYSIHRSPFPFTVLFLAAAQPYSKTDSSSQSSAIISRSNKSFRELLAKAGVKFNMPNSPLADRLHTLINTSSTNDADMHDIESDAALAARVQHRKDERTERELDLSAASVLLVQGRQNMQTLFDFLFHHDRRELNIPTLVASSVFVNSSSQSLNVVKIGSISKSKPVPAKSEQSINTKSLLTASAQATIQSFATVQEYTLDISGTILPANVVRLFHLFKQSQSGTFQAHFANSDYPPARYFNCIATVQRMESIEQQSSQAVCHEDSLAIKSNVYQSGREPVKVVGAMKHAKCNGPSFQVELYNHTS